MASGKITIGLATILVIMLWAETAAQSSSDCTNELISMSPCLNYITGNSSTPSSQCCSQVANVVRSSPQCLCEVLKGGGSSLGININQTQALALPTACNVQTPPVSGCNAGSPTVSPAAPSTPGSGSKDAPSTDANGTSNGSSIKLSTSLLFFLLFAASYGYTIQIG